MAKRRKLNKDFELSLSSASKKVELISAIINDIEDDDIKSEYSLAFSKVIQEYLLSKELYKLEGYTDNSTIALDNYNKYLTSFESEYEI